VPARKGGAEPRCCRLEPDAHVAIHVATGAARGRLWQPGVDVDVFNGPLLRRTRATPDRKARGSIPSTRATGGRRAKKHPLQRARRVVGCVDRLSAGSPGWMRGSDWAQALMELDSVTRPTHVFVKRSRNRLTGDSRGSSGRPTRRLPRHLTGRAPGPN